MDSAKITLVLATFVISIVGFLLLPAYLALMNGAMAEINPAMNGTRANFTAISNTTLLPYPAAHTTETTILQISPVFYVLVLLGLPIGACYLAFKA